MRKFLLTLAIITMFNTFAFSQERQAVVGLGNVKSTVAGEFRRESEVAANKLQSYLSGALVKAGRFSIMERNSDDMAGILEESAMQNGSLSNLEGLDFLLISKVVDYAENRNAVTVLGITGYSESVTMGIEVKFVDVSSGKIVISEVLRDSITGNKASDTGFSSGNGKKDDLCAVATEKLAEELISKIVERLYPPLVLSVSKTKVIMIPNMNYKEGNVIDFIELGEPVIDPYTKQEIAREETLIAKGVVFEVNGGIAKAMIDPAQIKYKKAVIEVGMLSRKTDDSVSTVTVNKLKKLSLKK